MRPGPSGNDRLVDEVRERARGYLDGRPRSERVLEAMRAVDRAAFLPLAARAYAYVDAPIDIGAGQTCSQPSMVAFMLDVLDVRPGARVLEIGAGSGWAAAIAAALAGPGGEVVACEIRPELAAVARANLEAFAASLRRASSSARALVDPSAAPSAPSLATIAAVAGDGSTGLPDLPPFDRILVSAGATASRRIGDSLTEPADGKGFDEAVLLARLAPRGVLVWPEARGSLHRLRLANGSVEREEWPGVAFVPLLGENA